jgi:dihydroorotate dehydrogenase (NAD+) catalytic subunit
VPALRRTLVTDLAGLSLRTPVMVASGCGGTGRELGGGLVDVRRIGALVSRTVTVAPRTGAPNPRIAETPSGIVWETGLQNPGIAAFCDEELPRLARADLHVIVSIGGGTLEEYVRLTSALQGRDGVAAIEVYLAGPDDELDRDVLGAHADRVQEIVGACARLSLVPVFAKLPHAADVVELARAAVRAGAHGVVLSASPPAMGLDAATLRPTLGAIAGSLSGPAVRPLTLGAVLRVASALPEVPLIAVGGIDRGEAAIEALLAGAWAVQVGTATLMDPAAPVRIAQGVAAYLKEQHLASPADLRGRMRMPAASPVAGGAGP